MSDATEAEVEATAKAAWERFGDGDWGRWEDADKWDQESWRERMIAAIAALDAVRGTEVEWGIRGTDGDVHVLWDERAHAEEWLKPGDTLVSRTVGLWTVVHGGA